MSDLVLALDRDPAYRAGGPSLPRQDWTPSEFGSILSSIFQKRDTPSAAVHRRSGAGPIAASSSQSVRTLNLETLEARSYDAVMKAKIQTSKIASHISDEYRHKLFRSLDRLHDTSEWEPGDTPMVEASFVTFLRTILVLKPEKWPSLGLSHQGHLFGIWGSAQDRVTLEFLENDQIKWVLTCKNNVGNTIRNAGIAPATSLLSLLAPYNPDHWFHA